MLEYHLRLGMLFPMRCLWLRIYDLGLCDEAEEAEAILEGVEGAEVSWRGVGDWRRGG